MNDLIEIALNQGISSLITVAVFILVYKYIDNAKKSTTEKFIEKTASNLEHITSSINRTVAFIDNITSKIIQKDKEKFRIAIELSFTSLNKALYDYAKETIINNNIDIKADIIKSNISHLVNNEYYKVYSTLALYQVNDERPSTAMKEEWKRELIEDIESIIFNDGLNTLDKINTMDIKLSIRIEDYSTYVYNKCFNK
jgi:hypothetical protein